MTAACKLAALLLVSSTAGFAAQSDGEMATCATQQTTMEVEACRSKFFEQKEVELNAAYQALLLGLKNTAHDDAAYAQATRRLVAAQRAWVQFRENDCQGRYKTYEGGTIRTVVYLSCKIAHTEHRIRDLKEWDAP